MGNKISGALVAVFCLSAAVAWSKADQGLTVQPGSRLWVDGTSSVRNFTCKATAFDAAVDAGADAVRAVLSGDKAVRGVDLTVATDKLDCGNGTMNGHMREAIKAKENPTITFRLTSYERLKGGDTEAATQNGVLTLGGADKPVANAVSIKDAEDGALHVTGSYDLSLKDYGLKAPTLMLGTMKVGDKVKVSFDLLLKA